MFVLSCIQQQNHWYKPKVYVVKSQPQHCVIQITIQPHNFSRTRLAIHRKVPVNENLQTQYDSSKQRCSTYCYQNICKCTVLQNFIPLPYLCSPFVCVIRFITKRKYAFFSVNLVRLSPDYHNPIIHWIKIDHVLS